MSSQTLPGYGLPIARPARTASLSAAAVWTVALALVFNAQLSIVNAHVMRLGGAHVALVEACLLGLALLLIVRGQPQRWVAMASLGFFYGVVVLALLVWLCNGGFYVKIVRDAAIVAIFATLGSLARKDEVFAGMRWIVIAMLVFMIMEGWFTTLYAQLFRPADYYAATRGIEELSTDSSGLFRNSLGFAGRFSFGIFDTHRLSSLMLEQVSLANFAMVLAIFASTFWGELRKRDRALYVFTVLFIILTNNTRTGALVCLVVLLGHHLFNRVDARWSALVMPLFIVACFFAFFDPRYGPYLRSDDLAGRVGYTLARLEHADVLQWFIGNVRIAASALDSGYLYLIATLGMGGIFLFWFQSSAFHRVKGPYGRFAFGAAIFVALNLMIGAGIFTIKVAGLFWFLSGFTIAHSQRVFDTHEHAHA